MRSLDLTTLPEGPYRSRATLVQFVLPDIHARSIRFIEEDYPRRETLEAALLFAEYSLWETPLATADSLLRLGFFPWREASRELDCAITHALCASYKATYDCARRALELDHLLDHHVAAHCKKQSAGGHHVPLDPGGRRGSKTSIRRGVLLISLTKIASGKESRKWQEKSAGHFISGCSILSSARN
jgi:hypothetical protein